MAQMAADIGLEWNPEACIQVPGLTTQARISLLTRLNRKQNHKTFRETSSGYSNF